MSGAPPLATLNKPCGEAVTCVLHSLEQAGFQAVRTFDLQVARLHPEKCSCEHHGTAQCNCQMVVLLVYQGNNPPATLVVHGCDQQSWFYLVNHPQQELVHDLEQRIQEALSVEMDSAV